MCFDSINDNRMRIWKFPGRKYVLAREDFGMEYTIRCAWNPEAMAWRSERSALYVWLKTEGLNDLIAGARLAAPPRCITNDMIRHCTEITS